MNCVACFGNIPMLSLLIFLPLLGGMLLFFMPKHRSHDIKVVSLIISLIVTFIGILLFLSYQKDPTSGLYPPIKESVFQWIPLLNSWYWVQLDGLNLLMVLLTVILIPILFLASWNSIQMRVKEFCIAILFVEMGILGAFLAQDLLLFFLFWEIMLIPTLFLIGIWGHEDRIPSAMRFLIFTLVGSLAMLFAIIAIYVETGTFSFTELYGYYHASYKNPGWAVGLFGAFILAFAIKIPMVPVHGWLPAAYKNAPIPGNVILAAILAKVGAYGILRIAIPIFPSATAEWALPLMILGVIAIIWGGIMAFAQQDLKQIIAYSSISHLGFVTIGLFSAYLAVNGTELVFESVQGAVYHMFNHGICIAGLFLMLGFLYERGKSYRWHSYGGLAKVMPRFSIFFMIIMLASIGLPGLNSFVGELLILFGTFKALPIISILAASGMILGAVYMLLAYQRIFFGGITVERVRTYGDLEAREIWSLLPLILLMIVGGLYPMIFLDKLNDSIVEILTQFSQSFLK